MEENKSNKSGKRLFNFSIVLSFAVSIFAVFSLACAGIAMSQGTGVSYALPVDTDTFTLKMGKKIFAYDSAADMTKAYIMETYFYNTANDVSKTVFCIEREKEVVNNSAYKKISTVRSGATDVSKDKGLIYLLGIGSDPTSLEKVSDYGNDVNIWVVQSAIWYYLNSKYGAADATYKLHKGTGTNAYLDDKAVIELADKVYLSISDNVTATAPAANSFQSYTGLTGQEGAIMKLVNEANNYTGPRLTVTKDSDEVSKTEDGNYYQSALITVVGNGGLATYDISLSGIEGAIVVNENGEELGTTNVPAATKFYVRIPTTKATESVQKVNVGITGHFTSGGTDESGKGIEYYYVEGSDELQRMASTKPGDVADGIEVEFVVSPDTGMNTTQTIYFIGLIVLLCGVGIVYANAKPLENKQ